MRIEQQINQGWLFSKTCKAAPEAFPVSSAEWQAVSLPHTWNTVDGQTGHPFERGAYWYVRRFEKLTQPVGESRLYVEIGAAALYSEIWVNGRHIASHTGGYSAFRADITDVCNDGDNILAILCDNTYRDDVYPQTGDFIFYGGLYRYVKLICVPESHFSLEDYGGPGVYIDSVPEGSMGVVKVRAFTVHKKDHETVGLSIFDADGTLVSETWAAAADKTLLTAFIPEVKLWDGPKAPHLYRAHLTLMYMNEEEDALDVTFGVRTASITAEGGFFLNGRSFPIRGVCQHQDALYVGSARTKEDHERDIQLIAEMGVNGVRLAHYQHAQETLDACDRFGLCTWAEIPYFARSWDDTAYAASMNELRELIAQNYNHPSVFFWGISNEIYLMNNSSPKLIPCHHDLEKVVKEMDPGRFSVLAVDYDTAWDDGLHGITDAEGWNHYFGWYRGEFDTLPEWCDKYHAAYPERKIAISEYGCDGVIAYHSAAPRNRDYTEEWQVLLHEHALETFAARPWIFGTFVWNMFDFGSFFRREGGTCGRNNKGLVTMDRKIKKDAYYVYKAWFSDEPFVHIDGRRFYCRPAAETEIKVHSNQKSVTLYVDGKVFEEQSAEHTFVFRKVPLHADGTPTAISASAGGCCETITLCYTEKTPDEYIFVPSETEKANWKDLDAALKK